MLTLKIILSAFLVTAVVAEPCTPDQWEGRVGTIVGTVTMGTSMIIQVNAGLSYDFTNKMLAVEYQYTLNSMTFNNKTIINYNTKTMYMIDNNKNMCTAQMIDMPMMKACVPPGSKETGPFYYGAGANNMLQATSFKFMVKINDQDTINGDVAVTTDGCIPIAEVVYGRIGTTDMMTTVGFADITKGIKNPAVFDPPAVCAQTKVREPAIKVKSMSFIGFPSHQ